MSSIPIHEPSLSSRAMLCAPSIAQWSASKHDRQAADEIEARHGAQPDVGRYHKLLPSRPLPRCTASPAKPGGNTTS